MLGAYTCKKHRALALEDKPFLPVVPSSQRHTQLCWGSQVSQYQSGKFSTHRSTRQFRNPAALLIKFLQHQGDTVGLPKQAPAFFLSVTKRSSSR